MELRPARERALRGNLDAQGDKLARQGKLFVRDRLALLLDEGTLVEDALLANASAGDLPADGVVTGTGQVDGRPVCVMANDPTVKAGSWGARTVEKIVRLTEFALRHELPVFWLVDSAGARITDQVELFPGRRGAGRIFYNQVRLSGKVPQICCLFGPSAAGGAYIPAFCDVVIMVEGNASMYLGSPRMAEMVIGEKTTLEEMGGARMHATVSGCGDNLATDDADAIAQARRYFSYLPGNWQGTAPVGDVAKPVSTLTAAMIPESERRGYDMHRVVEALVDEASFFEIKPLYAKELIVGFARLAGRSIGVVANNPSQKGGVLFTDSADKAARFIWCCDAFNVPLVFLADVPGFMVGTAVERDGIIRHGAKMITAVAEATVPKVSVIVRKAYGAGLYAMSGPAFEPEATIALPTAQIAVMGPEAAVNAVYANKIEAIDDEAERARFVNDRRAEYEKDVDLLRLASELVVDAIVEPEALRDELIARLAVADGKERSFSAASRRAPRVKVDIREVGPRDGLQAEAPVDVAARVALIESLLDAGVAHIEVAAFVSPRAVPAMAGAADVLAALTRRPGVVHAALVPNVKGAELALVAGVDELTVTVSASEGYSTRNVRMSVEESIASAVRICEAAGPVPADVIVSCAFGSPYEGDIAPADVAALGRRLADGGATRLTYADTTGMATPRRIEALLDLTGSDVGMHLHETRGTALVNAYAALQRGVRRFDTAVGGLGGSPFADGAGGNLATEDLVYLLDDLGIATGIDLERMIEVSSSLAALVGRPVPSRVAHAGPRSKLAPE